MYKNKKVLGITMARGGSKGIPRKNIKDLCGRPLLAYTIAAGQESHYLTRHIVSSEDKEIIEVAKKFGADVPFVRPIELAQDDTADIPVLQHAISWIRENDGEEYDYIMMLHPTAPLRLAEDIDNAIRKVIDTEADSVMGMKELVDFSIEKLKKIESDLILPLVVEEGKTTARRQATKTRVYKRNCAIYLTKTDLIMAGDLFGKISRPYIMPEERSIDINSSFDFEVAELYLKKRGRQL